MRRVRDPGPDAENHRKAGEIISRLNDCVSPISELPTNGYDTAFIDWALVNYGDYLTVNGDSFVARTPLKSSFCKAIEYADRHSEIVGILIVLLVILIIYRFYVCQMTRAHRLLPRVMKIIRRSHGQTCYVDEVKSALEREGNSLFLVWPLLCRLVRSRPNIRYVSVSGSKPFWTMSPGAGPAR
jgi:hypothetical protein